MKRRLIGALFAIALATTACDRTVSATPHAAPAEGAPPRVVAAAAAAPAPVSVSCDGAGTEVSTADQLTAALKAAKPGGLIRLAGGTYAGHFALATAGTADAPITVCGPRDAVLDGGTDDGYTLHLDHASYVRVAGFTVRGGQKGVMVDASSHVVVEGMAVSDVGEEAVHLRRGSSDNIVRGVVIRTTGVRTEKFGEGIYVGSAKSNWCTYSDCEPDRSDRNVLEGNDIAGTTAEAVDIKEGTTGGTLRGNTFSGAGMSAAEAWVNVKGNEWQIVGNVGADAPQDGFQTHRILDGWGARNTFADNRSTVNGPGYGINITKDEDDNHVACSNTAEAAAKGLSNIDCS
jgi:Periplasmic copper-binding protein (NosD)